VASFAVELRDVGKRFGSVVALDGVDLAIRKGEFFSLLGPSGCGKTTTLNLIGGFETASRGTLLIDGQPMGDTPSHARPVNTVFQSYALFPHMSVADNVGFGLRMKKVPRPERRCAVEEMLRLVSLEGYEERRPGELSGGQRQRVALARALINQPSVLLLDEPLGALDLKLRKQMQLELKRIQGEVGITFIFVTHDQEEAMTISDRIAVMNKGKIEQLGRPEDVYERPATQFVAEFLGASNLIDGTYRGERDGWGTVELGGGDTIRIPRGAQSASGSPVRVGVRPEKLHVYGNGGEVPADHNSIGATLRNAVFVGVSYQYFFDASGGRQLSAFDRNSGGGAIAAPGARVRLAWRPEHTFVIPAEATTQPTPGNQQTGQERH